MSAFEKTTVKLGEPRPMNEPDCPGAPLGGGRRLARRAVQTVGKQLTFTFDGVSVSAIEGDTIASALVAAGHRGLRQVTSDGSRQAWRGLYCGMGTCFECAVTVDGKAGQRSCLTKVRGGESVRSTAPSGAQDDQLRPLAPAPSGTALSTIDTDVLVIGAGPAGLRAALAAKSCGADVMLLDERAQSGGQYYKPLSEAHSTDDPIDHQFARGSELCRKVRRSGVRIEQSATVFGAFSPREVIADINGLITLIRPQCLILATGAYERAMPIPGWTLPGVITTGAAQTLARAYLVSPGSRIVIAGNGPLNFQLAADLVEQDIDVVALVESATRPSVTGAAHLLRAVASDARSMLEGLNYVRRLKRYGVPVYWSHLVTQADGELALEEVTIAPVDAGGSTDSERSKRLNADTLCLGYGFVSSTEIARALGCRMEPDQRHLGTLSIKRSKTFETSVEGVYAVGDGAHVGGASVAEAEGALAGAAAAAQLGFDQASGKSFQSTAGQLERAQGFQTALWALFKAPAVRTELVPDETILCRCENLSFGKIRELVKEGTTNLAKLKRQSRLGMGRCQGRYCTSVAARLLQDYPKTEKEIVPAFAPRFPAKPFPAIAMALERPEWGGHQRAGTPDLSGTIKGREFGSLKAEIVVIGAGVVGACLAYDLAKGGHDVVILDRDDSNLQASGSNAGSLHVQLLSFDFGEKAEAGGGPAAATLPLGPFAIDRWCQISETCRQDFDVRITGGLMVADSPAGLDFLKRKVALERKSGIEVDLIGQHELRDLAPNLSEGLVGAEYAPGEGKINPLTATYETLSEGLRSGARFVGGANVAGIEQTATGWEIQTDLGSVNSKIVINAAGPWARQVGSMVGLDLPVHSAPLQMIVTEPAPTLVEQLIAHADRHLSLKQLSTGGLVIGGAWTAKYDPEQNMNVTTLESLEGNLWVANQVLNQLSGLRVVRTWAGMNVNIDGAPILGPSPGLPGFYNAVSSNGYTLAPALSFITANLIAGRDPGFDLAPYLLDRF